METLTVEDRKRSSGSEAKKRSIGCQNSLRRCCRQGLGIHKRKIASPSRMGLDCHCPQSKQRRCTKITMWRFHLPSSPDLESDEGDDPDPLPVLPVTPTEEGIFLSVSRKKGLRPRDGARSPAELGEKKVTGKSCLIGPATVPPAKLAEAKNLLGNSREQGLRPWDGARPPAKLGVIKLSENSLILRPATLCCPRPLRGFLKNRPYPNKQNLGRISLSRGLRDGIMDLPILPAVQRFGEVDKSYPKWTRVPIAVKQQLPLGGSAEYLNCACCPASLIHHRDIQLDRLRRANNGRRQKLYSGTLEQSISELFFALWEQRSPVRRITIVISCFPWSLIGHFEAESLMLVLWTW
ncbi:unnamed protein product [Linum trigynum]|uniref:Uncharacterized protein n=1 Tax=Linum trigynum TaxID=586398 RepID=A0AAV2CL70_9ROSI